MQKKINMFISPYNKSIVAHEHVDFDTGNCTEEMVTSWEQAETNWGKIKSTPSFIILIDFILQSDAKVCDLLLISSTLRKTASWSKASSVNKKSFKMVKVKAKRKKNNWQNANFSSIVKNILGKKNPIALIKKSSTKLPVQKVNNRRATVANLEVNYLLFIT